MASSKGTIWFCTTAGARTALEEVPINPLPDQVNPDGSDPETTDSDLELEDDMNLMDFEGGDETSDGEEEKLRGGNRKFKQHKVASQQPQGTRLQVTSCRVVVAKAAKVKRSYRDDLEGAVHAKALLPACDIGAVELLTFFPNHLQWPEAGLRLYRNGWSTRDVAKMQLYSRGRLDEQRLKTRIDALRWQVLNNGKEFFHDASFTRKSHGNLLTLVTSYDASQYAPKAGVVFSLATATLTDVAQGVVNWPTGQDRGIVTQAIEYAHQNGFRQYTTVDIPQLAQQLSFIAPAEASTTKWDQKARGRVGRIVVQTGSS